MGHLHRFSLLPFLKKSFLLTSKGISPFFCWRGWVCWAAAGKFGTRYLGWCAYPECGLNPGETRSGALGKWRFVPCRAGIGRTDVRVEPSLYLSIYLSIHPSIDRSIDRSIYLSIYPSIHPSIDLSIYLSIHPSIHPSIHRSIDRSIYLSIYLSISLYIYILYIYL